MMFRSISFFVILVHLTLVAAFFSRPCSKNNCGDCTRSSWLFTSCRWCKRDNKCHVPGDLNNPCKRAENIVEESHCADELSTYDPQLSLKMLYLSAVAYDQSNSLVHQQQCLNNSLTSDNFKLQAVVTKTCDNEGHDCSGYVAVSHTLKVIVVAFRGSKNFNQALQQFLQTLVSPKTQFLNGEVQTYWKRGFDELWQSSMKTEVKDAVAKNPSYQIWVTGHSLGGAMASLASTWLAYHNIAPRKNIILYTFGMPRVGNYDYALQHDQLVNNSWRVVNDDDLVPHFPTLASFSIINGPYHHGVEAFYSVEATSVYSTHKECHGKPYNEDATCSFSEVLRSISKHTTYFSIPVGTFWETDCVPQTRKRREE